MYAIRENLYGEEYSLVLVFIIFPSYLISNNDDGLNFQAGHPGTTGGVTEKP